VYERVLLHPVPTSAPREETVMEEEPVQTSVAVAVPALGNEVGLQPSEEAAGQEVNTGALVSAV
jgi:hypothetical protein